MRYKVGDIVLIKSKSDILRMGGFAIVSTNIYNHYVRITNISFDDIRQEGCFLN